MERERNRVQYKTWRNVGLPMGKYNLSEVRDLLKLAQRTATKGRDGNSHVARDPARNLEQGPEGSETPIQVVLR